MRGSGLILLAGLAAVSSAGPGRAQAPPPNLPSYDLAIRLDTANKTVRLAERVTFTNRTTKPVHELVFCVYPLYEMPEKDLAVLAKTVELLRQTPSVALLKEPAGTIERVRCQSREIAWFRRTDITTAIVVPLPDPVAPGNSTTVEIDYSMVLPHKQGRWGYWNDVCYLANWFPQLAVHDEGGWRPTPFVPWHQPFYHEAGVFNVTITLPVDEVIATGPAIARTADRGDGWKDVTLATTILRDFALVSSKRFQEHTATAAGVAIRVVALPEHDHYARQCVKIASEAMVAYSQWFGPYPYPQFTVAESYFPWNGNECAGMVLLDHRVFQLPHLANGYVDYLLSHEICHQWWYSLVGTNGYAEPFMDEGPATYFSHRLLDRKRGKNDPFLVYPKGLGWLPNIRRESYRWSGWYSAVRRGESSPAVQPIDSYRHIFDLFAGAYDRGSRIYMMIEDRLGEAAFLDFTRHVVRKYSFRIYYAADLQRELEAYTGQSWDEFFKNWVYGSGVTDWRVQSVHSGRSADGAAPAVEVTLKQTREIDEPTVLGVKLADGSDYQIRIPIIPGAERQVITEPPGEIETVGEHTVRVRLRLPSEPKQISVDPDGILPDADPVNNHWHAPINFRFTPMYTQIDDASMANDFDRWTVQAGPWLYLAPSREPWYARSLMAGLRAGVVRPQNFAGGAFLAYRSDVRDVVVGVDGEWDHVPFDKTLIGFNVEKRILGPFGEDGPNEVTRAVMYGRYVMSYTSSMYLNPMHYIEAFGAYSDNVLPFARNPPPNSIRPDHARLAGIHYALNLLTPYWDPEGGFRVDLTGAGGMTELGEKDRGTARVEGQLTYVKKLPAWTGPLAETRVAARISGASGWPDDGLYFALGGSTLFRGYDLSERQGNAIWVGNLEWRAPIVQHVEWDVCDHTVGLRGVQLAAFYDVGAAYVNGHRSGPVAHALGGGLRWDVAVFSFIERAVFRLDVAKTVNDSTPVQVWIGFLQPF